MRPTIPTTAGLIAATLATSVLAHHSRANFDLESVVEVEGIVTEFSWRNPHAFVVVESADDNGGTEWTFELNSTPVLNRFGWTKDSLAVGDHVVARGNPDRDANRRFIYSNVFVRDDGSEIWSWGGPPVGQPVPVTQGSTDFSGVWRIRFNAGFDVLGRNRPDSELVSTLPVNAKGQAQLDAFDPDQNPNWDCAPESMPTILGHPYPMQIIRGGSDRLLIRYEVNNLERIVYLDMDRHPADVEPTPLGHSIGRFENGELVIETAGFSHVRWGNGQGVDSGERKTTVERYSLGEDGRSLALVFTMEDPEYLREPVMIEHDYNLTAGYVLQDYLCDPETSRRHLTAGEE